MKNARFGLWVIVIGLIAAFAAGIQIVIWEQEAQTLSDAQERIAHQMLQLRAAMTALDDAESGTRGYLLTGDEQYLRPYDEGRRALDVALGQLNEFSGSDPAALTRIGDLARLAGAKKDELARTVNRRRSGDNDGALAIVKNGEGQQLMDAFRDKTNALLADLRREGSDLASSETRKFGQASLLGGLLVAAIIFIVAIGIRWLSIALNRIDELQQRREQEAMHDVLTQLPNRRYLNDWVEMALAGARRRGQAVVLLYFDLDGFKRVNDRLGYEAGDRVLRVMAARLRRAVRLHDFVSRVGGDEFVAVLPDAPATRELSRLIARLGRDLAKAPIAELADGDVSASIGLARFPEDGDTLDVLLGVADRAMATAKEHRRAEAALPASLPVPSAQPAG